MFSKKELSRIQRKKRAIVARSDLLREECGEMWSVVARPAKLAGRTLGKGRKIYPVVAFISKAGLLYLNARYLSRRKYLGPLASIASMAFHSPRRPALPEA